MKILISVLFSCLLFSSQACAGTINSLGTYNGIAKGVAVGFWGQVGVGLDGVSCNGRNEVLLLLSNSKYKEILSVLLAAEASGKTVVFYSLTGSLHEVAPGHTYCAIRYASFGDFSAW